MTNDTITGPYEDGSYSYRGWTLICWADCNAFIQSLTASAWCRQHWHENGTPLWVAEAPPEVDAEGFKRIWLANPGAAWSGRAPPRILVRHTIGDTFPTPTIEAAIDLWEAARERLFREALTQAVNEL